MSTLDAQWSSGPHQTARTLTAAQLDVYETAVRAVTEYQQLLAGTAAYGRAGSLIRAWSDLTRDAAAIQLSSVRWMLDL